jgi:hypothetical protein
MRFLWLGSVLLAIISGVQSDSGSALYPPGLLPLINKANSLLSAGQFNDAAIIYSQAIGEFSRRARFHAPIHILVETYASVQSNRRPTICYIINGQPPIFLLTGIQMPFQISTKSLT